MRGFVRYQFPVVLWIFTIFALSSIPSLPEVKFPISPDKLGHMGIYFVLCLFWKRALFHQDRFPWVSRNALSMAVVLTIVYGSSLELYQMTVPGRFADPFDALANAIGAGMYAGWSLWRTRQIRARAMPDGGRKAAKD